MQSLWLDKKGLTACGVETTTASFTLEVLGLLVIDQDLEIIKVSFTVIAPWPSEDLVGIGVPALLLGHGLGMALEDSRGDQGSGFSVAYYGKCSRGGLKLPSWCRFRGEREREQESQSQAVLITSVDE